MWHNKAFPLGSSSSSRNPLYLAVGCFVGRANARGVLHRRWVVLVCWAWWRFVERPMVSLKYMRVISEGNVVMWCPSARWAG